VRFSAELPEKVRKQNPDVLIIDFHIPGHFSIDDIFYLREHFPEIRLLVISAHHEKQDVLRVLDGGVNGYLLKECDEEEVMNAVYAAARYEKFFCGRVLDTLLEEATHQCPPGSVCNHCQAVSLSQREVEVVRLIAEGNTNRQIAEKMFLSIHTIGTHRKNIFRKLKIRNSSELVYYALNKGIIQPREVDRHLV
jgi:two-component system NarL family response regulator